MVKISNRDFQLPVKGYSEGLPPHIQPPLTTGFINNMYPRGTLEKKIRLTQRPGLDKIFDQQIGGGSAPVVAMISVTTVD